MSIDTLNTIELFRQRLGPHGVLTEPIDKQPFEQSARHSGGRACAVLRPGSEDELAWTLKKISELRLPVVTQGAATGLVGAATPSADGRQWVLSTQRVRDVLEIDPVNRCAHVSAGFRLSDINRIAAEHGLIFPIDLGADPTMGGMVATNTGGARLIRYGSVRDNLLDVQAVLMNPAGQRVGVDRGLRKDNTGLNWGQLLCGTFGSLGVVSRATIKLHPLQKQSATALIAVTDSAAAIHLMCQLENEFGEMVSAFEGMSAGALEAVQLHQKNIPSPFAKVPAYAVLVEISSSIPISIGLDLEAMLLAWLEREMENGVIEDAIVDKPAQLWRIRHSISESVQSMGKLIAFDLAVRRSRFAIFREHAIELIHQIVPSALVCDFGHLGDGGVHLNLVVPPETPPDINKRLRDAIYDLTVLEFDGSFSAEHGLGPYNADYYQRFTDPQTKLMARALKVAMDPYELLGNAQLA